MNKKTNSKKKINSNLQDKTNPELKTKVTVQEMLYKGEIMPLGTRDLLETFNQVITRMLITLAKCKEKKDAFQIQVAKEIKRTRRGKDLYEHLNFINTFVQNLDAEIATLQIDIDYLDTLMLFTNMISYEK